MRRHALRKQIGTSGTCAGSRIVMHPATAFAQILYVKRSHGVVATVVATRVE
jgi:hypothetical protein